MQIISSTWSSSITNGGTIRSTSEPAEIITSITQTDGLITAGKKKIGELTLTGWTIGESVTSNESIADTDTVFGAFTKTQR